MKKRSKWTKWKVGAVGAASLAILFHEVKAGSAFAKAVAAAHPNKTNDSSQLGDTANPPLDDWTAFQQDPFTGSAQPPDQGARSHRHGRFHDSSQSTGPGQSFDDRQSTSSGQS